MEQLILHAWGDYLTQSDWMAQRKMKSSWAAFCHAMVYSLPFFLIGTWQAVAVVFVTHFFIDRFRLVRYVVWFKNLMGPKGFRRPWSECSATGYPPESPPWLSTWLMIIADNTLHITINYCALRWL